MKYLEHIKSKTPHERRQHATQIAGVAVAGIFLVWVTTLGVRLAVPAGQGGISGSDNQTQLAGASAYGSDLNVLEVATTTDTQQ